MTTDMTLHPLIQTLIDRSPVITDGAWGTQLQARGLAPGEVPDLWNLTHPEEVCAVARAYVEAGSQIILTNTFGANRIRLAESGCADRLLEINRDGVALSREAAGKRALVFASLGPSGKLIMNGDITEDELRDAFVEQAQALADGGADGLVVETMQDLAEAELAIAAAKATGLPVVASMVFDSGKDKDRTMMGTTPEQAAAGLRESRRRCCGSQLRPGHRRVCGDLCAVEGSGRRSSRLDQGQCRSAADVGWKSDLCDDGGGICRRRSRCARRRRQLHRRLLRHVAGFHPGPSSLAAQFLMDRLRLHVVACPSLRPELEMLAAEAKAAITFRHLEMGLHERSAGALHDGVTMRDDDSEAD